MKIIVNGATGRLGRILCQKIQESPEHTLVAACSRRESTPSLSDIKEPADVIIDFSNHESTQQLTQYAAAQKIPLVIAPSFDNLTKLTDLTLANNSLTDVSALGVCTSLTQLDISNNSLTDIQSIGNLTNLTNCNFSNNQVTAFPQWPADCKLVHVDGSSNQLGSVSPLSGLTNLNNVYIDHNPNISDLDPLLNCPVLIQVNAYGTNVTNAGNLIKQSIIVNYDPT